MHAEYKKLISPQISILIILFAVFILGGCGHIISQYQSIETVIEKTITTDLSDVHISGVKPGMNVYDDAFIEHHGKPTERERIGYEDDDFRSYTLGHVNLMTVPATGKIQKIYSLNDDAETGERIREGSSIDDVIEAYGRHYFKYTDQGVSIIGYVDHENNLILNFRYYKNKVLFYQLGEKSTLIW